MGLDVEDELVAAHRRGSVGRIDPRVGVHGVVTSRRAGGLIEGEEHGRGSAGAREQLAPGHPGSPGMRPRLPDGDLLRGPHVGEVAQGKELPIGDRPEVDREALLVVGQGLALTAGHGAPEESMDTSRCLSKQ